MKIELIGLKLINKGGLKATASIKIDEIVINEVKITETRQGLLVSMPSIVWIQNSQKYNRPAIELPDKLHDKVNEVVLEGYYVRKK